MAEVDRADPRLRRSIALGLAMVVVGLLVRWWGRHGAIPLVWNDSEDYVRVGSASLWSMQRWAGERPGGMPLLLGLAKGDEDTFVVLQSLLAALSWGVLAGVVAARIDAWWQQVLAAVAVLGFSVAWPVVMWDQQILSESVALSGLALVASAAIWFCRDRRPRSGATLIAAAAFWLVARDSHVAPVALVGLAMVVGAAFAAWRGRPIVHRRTLAFTGAFLMALSFMAAGSSYHGQRDRIPTENVYMARVLPYPERLAWFADHGMPDAEALESLPEIPDPNGRAAPFTPVDGAYVWGRWRAWIADHGRTTLLQYMATHPGYIVKEPRESPERVFNNGFGLRTYRPRDQRRVPLVATVLHPSTTVAVLLAGAAGAVVAARRIRWSDLAAVGAILVASSVPHALVVWHSDGMEATRHLLIADVQLCLGTLLLVIAAATGTARSRPAR